MKTTLQQALSQVLNADVIIDDFHLVEGGSISSAAKVVTNSGTFLLNGMMLLSINCLKPKKSG